VEDTDDTDIHGQARTDTEVLRIDRRNQQVDWWTRKSQKAQKSKIM